MSDKKCQIQPPPLGPWRVCTDCKGAGILHPLGDTIDEEDLKDDPELAEDLAAGVYDCEKCQGSGFTR